MEEPKFHKLMDNLEQEVSKLETNIEQIKTQASYFGDVTNPGYFKGIYYRAKNMMPEKNHRSEPGMLGQVKLVYERIKEVNESMDLLLSGLSRLI